MSVLRLALAAALLGSGAVAYAQETPLPAVDGTVAAYPFDEYGGDTAADISGFGNDAKLINSMEWLDGMSGGASVHPFDKDGYLELPPLDVSGDWTIQAWSLFPLENTNDGWRTLIQAGDSHHHVIVDSDGLLGVYIDGFNGTDTGFNVNSIEDGWHLVSAVGSGGGTVFYIDDKEVGKVGVQENKPIQYVGNHHGGSQQWGRLDCLRIMKVTRSPEDIAIDAAGGSPTPLPTPTPDPILPVVAGTLAIYSFGEGTGNRTADGSPNAYHATLYGGPEWKPGLIGTGLDFSSDGAYVATPSIDIGSAWTLQAWTKFPLPVTSGGWRTLIQNGAGHHHILVDVDGALGCFVNGFHPSGYSVSALSGWHLISAVGNAGQTKFYVDGDAVGTSDVQENSPVQYIGNYVGGTQNWGMVDSVRILNVAHSDAEIVVDANPAPAAPASPDQFTVTGATVPLGGGVHSDVVIRAGVTHIIALPVRIEVETKPAGTAFDGTTGLHASAPVASGTTASVRVPGPANGDVHWRVRAVNGGGGPPSGWVEFWSSNVNEVDVRFQNATPVATSASQLRESDGSSIASGEVIHDIEAVTFSVSAADADGDTLQLQVELQSAAAAYTGVPTFQSAFVAGGPAIACGGIPGRGLQKWQYRVVDSKGAVGPWTSYGTGTDFEVIFSGSSAASRCSAGPSRDGAFPVLAVLALAALLVAARIR